MIKSYSELIKIEKFDERIKYLQTFNKVGLETFGSNRYLNQMLYKDYEWRQIRKRAIMRDSDGDYCLDLGHPEYRIIGAIYVHHINPITSDDVINRDPKVFDIENLICASFNTHQMIHYGGEVKSRDPIIRTQNDTIPWR